MRRKLDRNILFLMVGVLGVTIAMVSFPVPEKFTVSLIFAELVFGPFSLLGSVIAFIVGFLCFSVVIRKLTKAYYHKIKGNRQLKSYDKKITFLLLISFAILFFLQIWVALFALGLSLFYGIMDADLKKEKDKVQG
ncbi:hypothetical protein [Bacillus sp. FJAT-45350]|uniref:hypothetical protein n=1 Tax=Bacillus sp. FJAT-45350 TaxID=2011014 RepID=UPI000BB7BF69|nr:hypothetical protein [Bacillus sp. FJAT-45350]